MFVRFVQTPATLFAWADSSVGGKTAINTLMEKIHWPVLAEVRSTALLVSVLSLLTLRCTLLPPAKPRGRVYCS